MTARPLSGNRAFRHLWTAQAVSAVGSRITRTVLPILALDLLGATASQVAVLSVLAVAPGLAVSLLAGGWIDRGAKRPMMIGADLLRAALLLTVPIAAALGLLGMAQIYLVAALAGAARTLFGIADSTFLPVIVDKPGLVGANARLEATDSVAEGVGPFIGGVLVTAIGAPLALAVDAVTYLWSALHLGRIDVVESRRSRGAEDGTGLLSDARAGLRAVRSHPLVASLLAVEVLTSFSGGFLYALYMVVAIEMLGLSPAVVGLIIGLGGLGSAFGALLAPWLKARLEDRDALLLALAVGQAFGLVVPLALLFEDLAVPLLMSGQLIGDGFMTAFLILAVSLRQEVMPERVMGRANATFHLGEGLALTGGALVAAGLVLVLPVSLVVWLSVLGGLLAVPLFLLGSRR